MIEYLFIGWVLWFVGLGLFLSFIIAGRLVHYFRCNCCNDWRVEGEPCKNCPHRQRN